MFSAVDSNEIGDVEEVFELRADGGSYRDIADETPLSKSAVGKVLGRREDYQRFLDLPEKE